MDEVIRILEEDSRCAYALLFGSRARGEESARSDLDLAVGLRDGVELTPPQVGELVSRLEQASRCQVDLVILDETSISLAYRIFRDGEPLVIQDRAAFVARKARAILEYLDFKPVEEICAAGVLRASRRG